MNLFVAFLAVVSVAAATKVDTSYKYQTSDVEYAHQYQPQQQQLHTAVVQPSSEEEQTQYHYQPTTTTSHHQASEKHEYKKHIPIVKSESVREKDGSYKFHFEAANGIQQQEHGYVKNAGQKDHEIQVQEGYYSYVDEHGHEIGVHYIADENGFRATGDHLPTPPPMPEALREAYAKVAANPELYKDEEEEQVYEEKPKVVYKHVEEQPEQTYEQVAYRQAPATNYRHHPQVHVAAASAAAPSAHHGHPEYVYSVSGQEYKN